MKEFADAKFKVAKMIISLLDRVENTVGKRERVFTSIFSFKPSSLGSLKVGIVW